MLSGCVKNYGPQVNVFVDHSQIVQLEMPPVWHFRDKEAFGTSRDVPLRPGSGRALLPHLLGRVCYHLLRSGQGETRPYRILPKLENAPHAGAFPLG